MVVDGGSVNVAKMCSDRMVLSMNSYLDPAMYLKAEIFALIEL